MKTIHRILYFSAIALVLAIAPSAIAQPDSSTLTVHVVGLKGDNGRVCVALYNNADLYPKEGKHNRLGCNSIKDRESKVILNKLPLGSYAAIAFHDEDMDGKLKRNFIGIPREGVGSSRNAKGHPPKFKDAKFHVGVDPKTIQIRLRYP